MAKTANVNVRIEPEIKARAEELFANLGMTVSEAVNIFLYKSLLVEGLPFDVKLPKYNAETLAAMQEAKEILAGNMETRTYTSTDEMFAELNAEAMAEMAEVAAIKKEE